MVAVRRIPLAVPFCVVAVSRQKRESVRFARLALKVADTGGASHGGA